MSDLGIEAIGIHVPATTLDSVEVGAALDASPQFIEEKLGFHRLCRKPAEQSTSELAALAFEDLSRRHPVEKESIECVVVVTQNPDGGGIPHVSARVHNLLDLSTQVACFDISLGCSGFVHGLEIIRSFMLLNGMRKGLLFTADPYSRIIDPNDRNTALLFGDASACTLVSDSPRLRVGKTCYATASQFADAIAVDGRDQSLRMSGNQVFRYVARNVPKQIKQCLESNQCEAESIELYLLHQGSKYIVDTLASNLGVDADRVPFSAGQIGNTVSSSIPLMLAPLLDRTDGPPARMLLSGFGVGLAAATTIVFRSEDAPQSNAGVSL